MKALQRGKDLRLRLHLSGQIDIEEVAGSLGLTIVPWKFDRVDEAKVGNMVAVSSKLSRPQRRWAIAHAIGHHLLHPGNHLSLRAKTMLAVKYERESEDFAYGLLVEPQEVRSQGFVEPWDVADYFGVPENMLALRGWQCALEL